MNILNIVAHPDDDLLFFNPAIAVDIANGHTVSVVYLTMGDDGRDMEYVANRYLASSMAYFGASSTHEVSYDNTVYRYPSVHLEQAGRVSLYRVLLPSNSFRNGDKYGSLYRLYQDPEAIVKMGNVELTRGMIIAMLQHLIDLTQPHLLRVHDPDVPPAIEHDAPDADHVDHIYSAKFALEAAQAFPLPEVYAYMGYPIRFQKPNLMYSEIEYKTKMWRDYQTIDTEVAGAIWDIALDKCYWRRL